MEKSRLKGHKFIIELDFDAISVPWRSSDDGVYISNRRHGRQRSAGGRIQTFQRR
jgi:hypothetical protein